MTPDDPLALPVQYLKGCGAERAALLARLELHTAGDLLWNLPKDVLDLSDVRPVQRLVPDQIQTVRGSICDRDFRQIAGGRSLAAVLLDCEGHYVRGVWFNQPWMLQKFRDGMLVLFSGKPKKHGGRWEFNHPRVQWLDAEDPAAAGVVPKYGLTEGLSQIELHRIIRDAVERCAPLVPEMLPEAFRRENQLPHVGDALRGVHQPATMDEYNASRRRLLFDDLLDFQLALALRRRAWKKDEESHALPTTALIDARIRRLFPFQFTAGQNKAVREIAADLASGRTMHRLLQADVGAGKTAVAIYAMLVAVAAGYQAALMAPTEVLAQQHWETIDSALAHSKVKRRLLTGSLTPAQRRQAVAEIASGDVQLLVGTQALIQEDVKFPKLAVAVIDEQHKFGVEQRAHFSMTHEGGKPPHVLVMTATPIPRSLCLTQFGDLDVSLINELPPGRQKVVTGRVTGRPARERAWNFIRKQLQSGRQAFIVCPRIEEKIEDSAEEIAPSAEQVYRQLTATELRDFRVSLIHGQMDRDQRADAMEAFRNGDVQALVSTTVIEVGVDVPNATMMIVMQAERFGLSQLHQLRGRIGRGKFQGYCFLFSETDSADAIHRLSVLESTVDGFQIAEADFELRGPGDILGTRQHGELPLKVANVVRDQKILLEARDAAFPLVESGRFDEPEFRPLKVHVLERFGRLMDLPQSG